MLFGFLFLWLLHLSSHIILEGLNNPSKQSRDIQFPHSSGHSICMLATQHHPGIWPSPACAAIYSCCRWSDSVILFVFCPCSGCFSLQFWVFLLLPTHTLNHEVQCCQPWSLAVLQHPLLYRETDFIAAWAFSLFLFWA